MKIRIVVVLALLAFVEFVLLPAFTIYVLGSVGGASYWEGILVLSAPRVIAVLVLVAIGRWKWNQMDLMPLLLGYLAILSVRFWISEIYIQPGNPLAWGIALLPYLLGFVCLAVGALLAWRQRGVEAAKT